MKSSPGTLLNTLSEIVNSSPSVSDLIDPKIGSIRLIIENNGTGAIKTYLVGLISDLATFFNFARTMNGGQVAQTAQLIMDTKPHLTPEHLVLFFKRFKTMKYGPLYEGIDGSKIMAALDLFDIEIAEETKSLLQEQANLKRAEKLDWHPDVTSAILKSLEISKKAKIPKYESKPRELTSAEKMMRRYFIEFDEIFTKQDRGGTGPRFINYKDKPMDIQQYVNTRYNEDFPKQD